MTKKETAQLLFLLKEYYPNSFESSTIEHRVTAWYLVLKDHDYQTIQNAMLAFVATDTKGFMPSVGQLLDKAISMQDAGGMTELEAWGLVAKALRNSAYGAAEEFAKLPPAVQRVVRDPQQLQEWALMDVDEVQTVISSNFQRSYRAAAKQERDVQALPSSVRQFLGANANTIAKPLPQGEPDFETAKQNAIKKLVQEVKIV